MNDFNGPDQEMDTSGVSEYEGRVIAGPFRGGRLQDIEISMRKFGILCREDGMRGTWERAPGGGYEVRAEGAGVRGYFVDDEGIEVSQSNLDAFIMEAVLPETDFNLRGVHQVAPDKMVAVSLRARHDGVSVVWTGSKALLSREDAPKVCPIGTPPMPIVGV